MNVLFADSCSMSCLSSTRHRRGGSTLHPGHPFEQTMSLQEKAVWSLRSSSTVLGGVASRGGSWGTCCLQWCSHSGGRCVTCCAGDQPSEVGYRPGIAPQHRLRLPLAARESVRQTSWPCTGHCHLLRGPQVECELWIVPSTWPHPPWC